MVWERDFGKKPPSKTVRFFKTIGIQGFIAVFSVVVTASVSARLHHDDHPKSAAQIKIETTAALRKSAWDAASKGCGLQQLQSFEFTESTKSYSYSCFGSGMIQKASLPSSSP
jgi:hypothetical protein